MALHDPRPRPVRAQEQPVQSRAAVGACAPPPEVPLRLPAIRGGAGTCGGWPLPACGEPMRSIKPHQSSNRVSECVV